MQPVRRVILERSSGSRLRGQQKTGPTGGIARESQTGRAWQVNVTGRVDGSTETVGEGGRMKIVERTERSNRRGSVGWEEEGEEGG